MLKRSTLATVLTALSLSIAGTAYSQVTGGGGGQAVRQPRPAIELRRGNANLPLVRAPLGPTVSYATTSFSCTNRNGSRTTYTLSVDGGSCGTHGPNNGPADQALCGNNSGSSASANCTNGCIKTEGSGSCTQTTTPAPS
jgi:hypothetical protein